MHSCSGLDSPIFSSFRVLNSRFLPPCRSAYPLGYGTRFITLPPFRKQEVRLASIPFTEISQWRTVSLQQMVLFGQNPSQGTLLKASQFLLGALFRLSRSDRPTMSFQRSYLSAWPTELKSSTNYHTISVQCHLSTRSRTGMLSRLRQV